MVRNKQLSVVLYVLLVAVCAGLLGWYSWANHPIPEHQILAVITFTVFLIAVEFLEVRMASGARWIPSATIDLSVWMLFGPAAAITMEMLSCIIGDGLLKRRNPLKVLFNLSMSSLAAGVAGYVYMAFPFPEGLPRDLLVPYTLMPAMLSLAVFSAINMAVTSVVISLSEGTDLKATLSDTFGWHFLSGLFGAPMAALLVFAYESVGLWSLILFGIPLYVVYQAHKLFEQMRRAYKSTVAALTTALEADEPYTHGHSYRVAQYALRIGRRMRMSSHELETLEYAGMLHDIGKIAITNDIVCKPARLSKEEFDILASHPAIGGEIVEQMDFLSDAADLVRHHHERPDGQGYPDGLKGDEISLGSHILNLCDAIDAMCSNRPYRAALSIDQCLEEVIRFRGTQFEAAVVDVFESMVREGEFEIIEQSDGAAQKIQEILRQAAEESARKRARLLHRDNTRAA